jgi:hypothetical protein
MYISYYTHIRMSNTASSSSLSYLAAAATAAARPVEIAMGRTLSGGSLPDPPHTYTSTVISTVASAIAFVTSSSPGATRADGHRVLAGERPNTLVQAVIPFKSIGLTVEYGEIYLQIGKGYSNSLKDELLEGRSHLPPINNLVANLKKLSNRDARIFLQTYLDPRAWKILVALL